MGGCASCERQLASTWKFCIYCGRPFVPAEPQPPEPDPVEDSDEQAEPLRRKYDGAFWLGVGMGALGLALIIYASIQIFSVGA